VIVFFVLSGFVIAWTADTKERTFRVYIINRLARLWSVAIPALALTLVVDKIGMAVSPQIYLDWLQLVAHPLERLAMSAVFLNQMWFLDVQPLSNGPFWSLSYEWWYYVTFGCITLIGGRKGWLLGVVAIAIMGPKIWLLFPTWLMGVAVYRNLDVAQRLRPSVGLILFLAPLGLIGIFALEDAVHFQEHIWAFVDDRFIGYSRVAPAATMFGALMALHLYSLPSLGRYLAPLMTAVERPIRWIAGATLSIYLYHYPLLHIFGAMAHVTPSSPIWVSATMLCCTLVCCIALSAVTESKKRTVRALIETVFGGLSAMRQRLLPDSLSRG
jgi:peptidoglycan/LPS O-acetylase OafA/YrhL